MKSRKLRKTLGMWCLVYTQWVRIYGTTPRNAGYWNLNIGVLDFDVKAFVGKHVGVEFWFGEKLKLYEWKPKDCTCFGCMMHKPLPPGLLEAIRRRLFDDEGRRIVNRDNDE